MAMNRMGESRPDRTEEELREAAGHVNYEIEMLVFAAEYLGRGHSSPPTIGGNEKNMALESFLLHFRNLAAFLCPSLQTPFRDDILASDFFGERVGDHGKAAKLSADGLKRLQRMLAHLTYSRSGYISADDYDWKTSEMLMVMLEELQGFVTTLPCKKTSWFPPVSFLAEQQRRAKVLGHWQARADSNRDPSV